VNDRGNTLLVGLMNPTGLPNGRAGCRYDIVEVVAVIGVVEEVESLEGELLGCGPRPA